jgi:arylformamidase
MPKVRKLIDLTRKVTPGKERFRLEIHTYNVEDYIPGYIAREPDDWYIIQDLVACSHIGTHIEAPLHHIRNGYDASRIPLEAVLGDAAILDFLGTHAETEISQAEVVARSGHLHSGDIALIRTGWSRHYGTPEYARRPFLAVEAVRWLIEDRHVRCIGVDSSGIENISSPGQPIHRLALGRGIALIEDLDNLEAVETPRTFLIALPLRIEGLDSSPARIVAVEFAS